MLLWIWSEILKKFGVLFSISANRADLQQFELCSRPTSGKGVIVFSDLCCEWGKNWHASQVGHLCDPICVTPVAPRPKVFASALQPGTRLVARIRRTNIDGTLLRTWVWTYTSRYSAQNLQLRIEIRSEPFSCSTWDLFIPRLITNEVSDSALWLRLRRIAFAIDQYRSFVLPLTSKFRLTKITAINNFYLQFFKKISNDVLPVK